jgi:hypothetical protein
MTTFWYVEWYYRMEGGERGVEGGMGWRDGREGWREGDGGGMGWRNRQMKGGMERGMDGWMDGWMNEGIRRMEGLEGGRVKARDANPSPGFKRISGTRERFGGPRSFPKSRCPLR